MTTSSTPPRNNYAAPHTPIASAKRPRSSLERAASTTKLPPSSSSSSLKSPSPLPPPAPEETAMSPMHPPKPFHREDGIIEEDTTSSSWVGRVDALFSPVLSFLGSSKDDEEDAHPEEEAVACITDEDVTMDEAAVPTMTPTEVTSAPEEEEEHKSETGSFVDEIEHDYSSSYDEDDEEEFNPYLFIKSLPSYDAVKHLRPNIALPEKEKDSPPISLVLDLDETLVHCTIEPVKDADLVFPVVFHGAEYQVHVRLRPHLFQFLESIKGKYEVIVFTASQKVYADELLNRIDPDGKFIQHRMFRESCLTVEGNYLKDLNVLGRDLNKTVLVDNSPHAFGYQVDNGIPIESWFDDPNDSELLKLAGFLDTLLDLPDVKEMVRQKFQTYKLIQAAK